MIMTKYRKTACGGGGGEGLSRVGDHILELVLHSVCDKILDIKILAHPKPQQMNTEQLSQSPFFPHCKKS
jgi:hypothetical protein